MKSDIPPFYSGETVVGRVVGLAPRFATIKVCGRIVPLEVAFMDWNALRTADEALSIGDRVEAVVYTGNRLDEFHQRRWMWPKQVWNGAWLNRLPLLDDPWPRLMEKYSDGSVVEVEMVDYVNWYIARARLPSNTVPMVVT